MADPFLTRRYDLLDALKLDERARFYREHGPEGCLRLSEELRRHALALRAETADERAVDLAHHLDLRAKLDRAARGLERR